LDQLTKYAPASDVTQQNQSVPVDDFAKNLDGMYYNGFWDIGAMESVNPKIQSGDRNEERVCRFQHRGLDPLCPRRRPSSKMKAIEAFFSYVFAPRNEIDLTGIMPQ